ncbi:MAG: N-acetylmuramoyl-L-alanine amidase [Polyangiaceae bacterium]|nr:N-acetylmuramoyl-L-alanine amidase [Polyangiaceae bacterium]
MLLGCARPCLLLLTVAACSDRDGSPPPGAGPHARLAAPPGDPASWPTRRPEALPLEGRAPGEPVRVYLDAGHGAPDNAGNLSCYCRLEEDFTASLADDVALELEATGRFAVVPSRVAGEIVGYAERVAAAEMTGAEAFVSLHSDVRGRTESWSPFPGASCPQSLEAPGFGVFYSDEGAPELALRRRALALAVAEAMRAAGFLPYGGADYGADYLGPTPGDGVFVDRHELDKRIYVLRAPEMPAVLVETHNAHDPREAVAWDEPAVRRAFALALGHGLERALR